MRRKKLFLPYFLLTSHLPYPRLSPSPPITTNKYIISFLKAVREQGVSGPRAYVSKEGARESDFRVTENKRKKVVVGRERAKEPGRDKQDKGSERAEKSELGREQGSEGMMNWDPEKQGEGIRERHKTWAEGERETRMERDPCTERKTQS